MNTRPTYQRYVLDLLRVWKEKRGAPPLELVVTRPALVAITSAQYNVEEDAKTEGVQKVTYRDVSEAEYDNDGQRVALVVTELTTGFTALSAIPLR